MKLWEKYAAMILPSPYLATGTCVAAVRCFDAYLASIMT